MPIMCHPLCKLLGYELSYLSSGEKLTTAELAKICQTIGLLFVADELCTPQQPSKELKDLRDSLMQLYEEQKKHNKSLSFQIVLIPMNSTALQQDSDHGIKGLFKLCDCPILIYSSECKKAIKIQEYLIQKFEVQQSSLLVLLNAETVQVITYDGREKLLQDPKGEKFPWENQPYAEILNTAKIISKVAKDTGTGSKKSAEALNVVEVKPEHWQSTVKGLLFAAFWCPPCRSFTVVLNELYEKINKDERKLEIIFVSSDRSQESFERFFFTMPWLAVPYEEDKLRNVLMKAFNVKAIPSLILLDSNDKIITNEGRLEVNDDLEGIEFPWYPRLVDELRDRHTSTVNNSLCVIYFTDDSENDYEQAELILNPIASDIESSDLEEALEPKFFIAADSDLAESLRIFMELDETKSYLVIMDIANFRYTVRNSEDTQENITESCVKQFLHDFQANKLIYKYIQTRFI